MPGTQALRSPLGQAGQQAGGRLHCSAHPVPGAELRTSKQREESSPSGYEGSDMGEKLSYSSPPLTRSLGVTEGRLPQPRSTSNRGWERRW